MGHTKAGAKRRIFGFCVSVALVFEGCTNAVNFGISPYVIPSTPTHGSVTSRHFIVDKTVPPDLLDRLPRDADRTATALPEQQLLLERGLYLRADGHISRLDARRVKAGNHPAPSQDVPHYRAKGSLRSETPRVIQLPVPGARP